MIYVTGDTHGNIDFQKLADFAKKNKNLGKNDFVIIAGDFGAIWIEDSLDKDLKKYEELPFSVLFVDGNHENFDLLNSYPVEKWNGGKVHKIKPTIIHLMRGQVFEIEGKSIFTFGGATSVDKSYRIENISWWRQELPSYADYDEALNNLRRYNNKVDYIITHSCDEKTLHFKPLLNNSNKSGVYGENIMLSNFEQTIEYSHWYFGHFHLDGQLTDNKTVLYQKIIKIT